MPYHHLTQNDRHVIYHLINLGFSYREIARQLGKHHSTISREIRRNGAGRGQYWHEEAQWRADAKKHQARHTRKQSHTKLYQYVLDRIQKDWSPDAIVGRLKRDYPNHPTMRISIEGIYHWIYRDALAGGDLFRHCRRHHQQRRKQRKDRGKRYLIPDRVSIHTRPAIVETRARIGDWEGDTIEGQKGRAHVLTHVDRKSRYLLAAKLASQMAATTADRTVQLFHRIPRLFRRTLTLDNGKEFTDFKTIEMKTGLTVYFADRHCPWQRGTNENTNGLLRQYFPKGSDLGLVSDEALAAVVKKLNNRPRKCLHYRTPHEVFFGSSSGALAT